MICEVVPQLRPKIRQEKSNKVCNENRSVVLLGRKRRDRLLKCIIGAIVEGKDFNLVESKITLFSSPLFFELHFSQCSARPPAHSVRSNRTRMGERTLLANLLAPLSPAEIYVLSLFPPAFSRIRPPRSRSVKRVEYVGSTALC